MASPVPGRGEIDDPFDHETRLAVEWPRRRRLRQPHQQNPDQARGRSEAAADSVARCSQKALAGSELASP